MPFFSSHHPFRRILKPRVLTAVAVTLLVVLLRTTGAFQTASLETVGTTATADEPRLSDTPTIQPDEPVQSDSTTEPTPASTSTPAPTQSNPAPVAPSSPATPAPAPSDPPASPAPNPSPPPPATSPYRDGTYYAEGGYSSPGGFERIGITLVLSGGKITSTSAKNLAAHPTSAIFQNDFISHYATSVVGKPIADLQLGKVSGASLTPIGFNNAAAAIRSQAS